MTENEIKEATFEDALYCAKTLVGLEMCEECRFNKLCHVWCDDVYRIILDALEEIQQYRAIGTVEEIKSFFNENRKAGYKHGYSDGYAKAIEEFAERITKRLKEEVALLEQERTEAREYDDEQIIFATSNQLRAFDYGLRVIAEEMRGAE